METDCGLSSNLFIADSSYIWYPRYETSLVSAVVKNPSTMQEIQVQTLGQKDHLEKEIETHFSQYSFLGNPVDKGSWWAIVHGVVEESDRT